MKPVRLMKRPKGTIEIPDFHYDFDSDKLSPRQERIADSMLVSLLDANPELIIEIQSHTDSKGSDKYNKKLSQDRAEAATRTHRPEEQQHAAALVAAQAVQRRRARRAELERGIFVLQRLAPLADRDLLLVAPGRADPLDLLQLVGVGDDARILGAGAAGDQDQGEGKSAADHESLLGHPLAASARPCTPVDIGAQEKGPEDRSSGPLSLP